MDKENIDLWNNMARCLRDKLLLCRDLNTSNLKFDKNYGCLLRITCKGEFFEYYNIIMDGCNRGRCHQDSCSLFLSDISKYQLITGYSFSSNEGWARHTWILDMDNNIIETQPTSKTRDIYYGYIMSNEEATWFCDKSKNLDGYWPELINYPRV